ncbi:hypothetical protein BO83DRAFT_42729 [Aspergillus eucalypticola CBS 122712]|uniref:Uncharacterized protein n=1 Tax=Aspergillus eucalypticola (strain CBS 122712 / IBT 29274) TaxID=1448314 RepID=A0A317VC86_ASPEC|nr:uncharacterized protein BO83DRAFT_42729 [Aspergillus eucalypticola CBS 122712]PWY71846.1 hypothetical protein BO83DRAFT_42729 [Aspergillus eucalypticola CBS 122712]
MIAASSLIRGGNPCGSISIPPRLEPDADYNEISGFRDVVSRYRELYVPYVSDITCTRKFNRAGDVFRCYRHMGHVLCIPVLDRGRARRRSEAAKSTGLGFRRAQLCLEAFRQAGRRWP